MLASPSSGDAPKFSLSCDRAQLDYEWMAGAVLGSYWGGTLKRDQIYAAFDESLIIGAYDGAQIGFVRLVTDKAIWSSLTDLYVAESHRNGGVGSALVKAAVEHPHIEKTMCILQAKPEAWFFYNRTGGFQVVDRKSGIMQRMPK